MIDLIGWIVIAGAAAGIFLFVRLVGRGARRYERQAAECREHARRSWESLHD